ncbi:MAG: SDR family oxidoreductase [Sedimenticola thiotaurini]|uniref:SDR family oxidoreductase n=1 Tax=Sedimenticola thiotaurini TaxID=1543721 RepID=A0A558DAR7_9GAMM|nr:MAG: SDR family oxidoreductase [Sedimenticola thiotaurini]
MRILLTGATGFIGRGLLERVTTLGNLELAAAVRKSEVVLPEAVEKFQVTGLEPDTDWRKVVRGIDTVIHSAARVHVMKEVATDPLSEFRRINVDGTLNFARQAVEAGLRRFIFISSIKVNGESTIAGIPYFADAQPMPTDSYGISKMEAEQGLRALAEETGLEVVIIRPTLVYGPGVKANFFNMMRWLQKGVPLPFGAINNRRSLIALDNLVDLIVTCIDHPSAANQTFLVSDDEDLSTTELLWRTAAALGKPARLVPVPQGMLVSGLRLLGKGDLAQRLCGSLQVDISKTRALLGWTPPVSVDEGLRRAVAGIKVKG